MFLSRRIPRAAPLAALVAALLTLGGSRPAAPQTTRFHFHHEGVLGTSLDLIVTASDQAAAQQAEQAALAEIERLRRILSTYDPASEISLFNAGVSTRAPELLDLLSSYDDWRTRTRGVLNAQAGELSQLWRAAARAQHEPDARTLATAVSAIRDPAWALNECEPSAMRLTSYTLNVDCLGKALILGRAAAAARTASREVRGVLLNIGGDILASGAQSPWRVSVADPRRPADNAPPLTRLLLTDRAVATSAGYERGFTIDGRRYSHILDLRTGRPASGVASATVVAANNVTANALALSLNVLAPHDGLKLAGENGAECLIVADDGTQFRSEGFAAFEAEPAQTVAKASLWPKSFLVTLTFTLNKPGPQARSAKRPYVAVWVDDAKGKRVRTVAVWGNRRRYLPDLFGWWKLAQDDERWAESVTRATRPAGRHTLEWDGRDDAGNPLPPGTYTVFLEAHREHGGYSKESAKIVCGAAAAKAVIVDAKEFSQVELNYGPKPE